MKLQPIKFTMAGLFITLIFFSALVLSWLYRDPWRECRVRSAVRRTMPPLSDAIAEYLELRKRHMQPQA